MKTKDLPAIVMLLAGAVYCLIGIRDKVDLWDFTLTLFIVLLVFYILGGIVKVILDKCMVILADKPEEEEETDKEGKKEETDKEESEEDAAKDQDEDDAE